MSKQHECVARFYDEHPKYFVGGGIADPQALAERMLDDGRRLSADYERLRAALEEVAEAPGFGLHDPLAVLGTLRGRARAALEATNG